MTAQRPLGDQQQKRDDRQSDDQTRSERMSSHNCMLSKIAATFRRQSLWRFSVVQIGRTSTAPCRAAGPRAAQDSAALRSGASIK